jgi:hypothetical protein
MTVRMNAALRLAGSALGALIAFACVPTAMAQWAPAWRAAASYGDIAGRLEAQGYVLIAPLQRRPGVYLADVRAGPAGYQRLVIDDRSGEILERFMSPPRSFGPQFVVRYREFAEPPLPGAVQLPPDPGFSDAPNGGPAAKSAYSGPTSARIPSAISPFGSRSAPVSTKPKPKPAATARKTPSPAVPPVIGPPLPPPAAREAAKSEESAPLAPKPKIESPPGESKNASTTGAPAEPVKIEPQPDPQTQSSYAAPDPTTKSTTPASSVEASDKSKTSIVPPALFE